MRYLSVAAVGPALQFRVSARCPDETTAPPTICPERGKSFPQFGSYDRC
jgi:hypothetical protein